ncbi:ABC transporter permease [Aquabacterium sp. J223]|uniref:ABC transporter permease n=1 Tax=Aquabacterium sp. J223 TaxID=2898431 RepID=UPI0021ADBDE5|nr:iron ABC transporter permease [Aquabacterium sp. J223]UUX97811.1 iron ABC transporter permease [Aquabacterium sp. J223]
MLGTVARAGLVLFCALLALPVLGVLGAWFAFDEGAASVLRHQAATVLPAYAAQSALLAVSVALGVATLGGATAAAVALFDFPGRRTLEWALLLPLAMPAYVLAYAYTDFLQFSGPLQVALRQAFGWQGALWPDVRSLWGAVVLFVLALYPYAYLLVRAALAERGLPLMEAARLLGASLTRRVLTVALPLARPALAAGVALALMETLADYGVGAYFGLTTFTTGVYKAWLVMNDRIAAAQLATVLLAVVALLLLLERRAQRRLRFAASRRGAAQGAEAQPVRLRGVRAGLAMALCGLPVLLGFVLPVVVLARLLWLQRQEEFGLPLARFAQWAWNSFSLSALAALAAALLAFALGFALRQPGAGPVQTGLRWSARAVSLGYAVPGAVIAVGLLLPTGWLQAQWPQVGAGRWVTGTLLGLLYAYLVRFCAVALQTVEAGYARIPTSLDDSARMLGAGPGRVLRELHAPLMQRSVLVAALLVFVDVMKELPATLVLRPFNSDTLAVVAYNFARDERLAEAALPSLAIVAVGMLPVLLLSRTLRRQH